MTDVLQGRRRQSTAVIFRQHEPQFAKPHFPWVAMSLSYKEIEVFGLVLLEIQVNRIVYDEG